MTNIPTRLTIGIYEPHPRFCEAVLHHLSVEFPQSSIFSERTEGAFLKTFKKSAVDLVVISHNIRQGDNFNLLRNIQKAGCSKILFYSFTGNRDLTKAAKQAGANATLEKVGDLEQISFVLRRLINAKAFLNELQPLFSKAGNRSHF